MAQKNKNALQQFFDFVGNGVNSFVNNVSKTPVVSAPNSPTWGQVANNVGNFVHDWQQSAQQVQPYINTNAWNPLGSIQALSNIIHTPQGQDALLKITQNPIGNNIMQGLANVQGAGNWLNAHPVNLQQYVPTQLPQVAQVPLRLAVGIPEAIANVPHDIWQAGTQIGNDATAQRLNNPLVALGDYAQAGLPLLTIATLGEAGAPEGLLRSGLKNDLLSNVITGAKTGSKYGAGFGFLQGVSTGRDMNNPVDYLANLGITTGEGVLGGAFLGGTLGGSKNVIKALGKVFEAKTLEADPVKAYTEAAGKVVDTTPKIEDIAKTAMDQTKTTGGTTINVQTGEQPKAGFAFSPYKDAEVVIPKEIANDSNVAQYVQAHFDKLSQPGNHLGMWEDNGNIYFDISQVNKNLDTALKAAVDNKQLAVYNLGTGEDVLTPLHPNYGKEINSNAPNSGENIGTNNTGSATSAQELPQPTTAGGTASGEPTSGINTSAQSVTPDNITPQPEGLKVPLGEISTAELQARLQKNTKFADSYTAELQKRGISVPPQEGVKERGLVESIRQNETNRPGVRQQVQGTYDVTTDAGRLAYGREYVKTNYNDAIARVSDPKEPLSNELSGIYYALNEDLQIKADTAERTGNINEAKALDQQAAELDNQMAAKLTPIAQMLQFAHVWSQKTPEAMVRWAQNIHEQANQIFNLSPIRLAKRAMGGDWKVELTPERVDAIRSKMREINRISDPLEKQKATQTLMSDIVKDIPPSVLQYTDAYRYQNMLINPLTQLRNTYFNVVNTVAIRPATVGLKGVNDTLYRAVGGKAEGRVGDLARYYEGLVGGADNAVKEFANALEGKDPINQKINDTGVFSSYNQATSKNVPTWLQIAGRGMEASDRFFTELIANAEYNIGKSKGLADEAAKTKAYETAAQFLYRKQLDPANATGQGLLLSKMDGLTDWIISGRKKVGPLGWFVPFVRVPMAVAKMSLEYNPITGPATLIGNADKSAQLAKMEIGSLFFVMGSLAALNGNTTWAAPSDPKQKQAFYDSGRKPFSVKLNFPGVGERWVPMQYLGPLALNFALPAAFNWYQNESRTATTDSQAQKLFNIATSVLNYWSQSTPVAGLGGFVNMASGNVDYTTATQLAFTGGQLIPFNGLVTYIANLLDPVYRDAGGTFMGQIKKGLPLISKTLPAYTDASGNPSTRPLSSSLAPYALGTPNAQFEQAYQDRSAQLQQNAEENAIKKQVQQEGELMQSGNIRLSNVKGDSTTGGTSLKLVNNKVYYYDPVSKTAKSIDFTDLVNKKSGIDAYTQEDALYKKAREIWGANMSQADKNELFKQLKLDPNQVRYDYLANQTTKVKTNYFIDKASGQSHQWILDRITTGRYHSLSDNMFITDTVLKNIYDAGLINRAEYNAFKNTEYDLKGNRIKTGSGTSNSSLKISANYPSIKVITPNYSSNALKISPLRPTKTSVAKLPKMPKAEYKSSLKIKSPKSTLRPAVWSIRRLGRVV